MCSTAEHVNEEDDADALSNTRQKDSVGQDKKTLAFSNWRKPNTSHNVACCEFKSIKHEQASQQTQLSSVQLPQASVDANP